MALTLRPTNTQGYRGGQDWTIFDDGKPVGRIYENTSESTSADLRWFWSITVYVQPSAGIRTSDRAATLGEAKTAWLRSWTAWGNAQRQPKG